MVYKDLEQVHLVIGAQAPSAISPMRHALILLNAVLGGSMSSWLFQEIREKRGLAYAVCSYLNPYLDAGLFGIYTATDQEKIRDVLALVREGLDHFRFESLSERELLDAKEQIKGNFLLGMESTDLRMSRLARNEFCFGRPLPPEEFIARIDAVTEVEIRDLAGVMFRPEAMTITALGPISESDLVF